MADVVTAEVGGWACIATNLKKKLFIETVKRGISPHGNPGKQAVEVATVTFVKLCKSCTYINGSDSITVFTLIENVANDLIVSTY